MLIEVVATLRLGDKQVPLIFMSDGTHLSDVAGDKTEWPVYMTIRNLSWKIRQMPSSHTVVMVALPPIPHKNRNIPQNRLDEPRQTNSEVLNEVLQQILEPLETQSQRREQVLQSFLCRWQLQALQTRCSSVACKLL